MNLNEIIMTTHCRADRLERLVAIATTIGFGDVVLEVPTLDGLKKEVLLDSGALLIMDKDEKVLVTALVPSISRVTALYNSAGIKHIPQSVYNKVVKNQKKYKDFIMEGKRG